MKFKSTENRVLKSVRLQGYGFTHVSKTILVLLSLIAAMCLQQTLALAQENPVSAPILQPFQEIPAQQIEHLTAQLRCLVCQNQSIADSHSEFAVTMRKLATEKLASGMSEQQVIDFMVQRYGDYVVYRPPLKNTTYLLWFGPFILLAISLVVFAMKLKSSKRSSFQSSNQSSTQSSGQSLIAEAGEEMT